MLHELQLALRGCAALETHCVAYRGVGTQMGGGVEADVGRAEQRRVLVNINMHASRARVLLWRIAVWENSPAPQRKDMFNLICEKKNRD